MSFLKSLLLPFATFFKKSKKTSRPKHKKQRGVRLKRLKPRVARKKKIVKKVLKPQRPSPKAAAKAAVPSGVLMGDVTHYFSKIQVIVVKITNGKLLAGERIHIKGQQTDFVQAVQSMQIESVDVKEAKKGQLIGLKVAQEARVGDKVFKL